MTVTFASNPTSPTEPPISILAAKAERQFKTKVRLVKKKVLVQLKNLVLGFVWGEQPGLAGAGGDILASILVWGDLRDVIVQLLYGIFPGGNDIDWYVFGFALLGLALELVPPGIGENFDALPAVLKVLFKQANKVVDAGIKEGVRRFLKLLVKELAVACFEAIRRRSLEPLIPFLRLAKGIWGLGLREDSLRFIGFVLSDKGAFEGIIGLAKRLSQGDEFATLLKKLKAATNVGTEGVQKTILVLSGCGDDVVRELIQSNKALNDLTKVLDKSKVNSVNVGDMKKVLENTTLFGNSAAGTVGLVKREEVLADLAKVSHSERLNMLLVGKRGSAGGLASLAEDQLKGALGELMVGSAYGNNVKRFRIGLNSSEFDIELIDGTLVEVSWKTTPKIEGVKSKLEIMKHKGKTKIVFAFGPEAQGSGKGFIEWKSKVMSEAQARGITVEFKKVIINPDGSKGLIDL